jgi:hypothetical protein
MDFSPGEYGHPLLKYTSAFHVKPVSGSTQSELDPALIRIGSIVTFTHVKKTKTKKLENPLQ